MVDRRESMCEYLCGYITRICIIGLGLIGIMLSVFAMKACDMIYYFNKFGRPNPSLEPPFSTATRADVGIFRYQITEGINGTTMSSCADYEYKYFEMADYYEALTASQICSIVAPILAGIGILASLCEVLFCNFAMSFTIPSFLFLAAAGIQGGTFAILAEPSICFEDEAEQECEVGSGTYMSATAVVVYFIAGSLCCCVHRPKPLFWMCGDKHEEEEPTRKSVRTSAAEQPTPIIIPIVVDRQSSKRQSKSADLEDIEQPKPKQRSSTASAAARKSDLEDGDTEAAAAASKRKSTEGKKKKKKKKPAVADGDATKENEDGDEEAPLISSIKNSKTRNSNAEDPPEQVAPVVTKRKSTEKRKSKKVSKATDDENDTGPAESTKTETKATDDDSSDPSPSTEEGDTKVTDAADDNGSGDVDDDDDDDKNENSESLTKELDDEGNDDEASGATSYAAGEANSETNEDP